MPRTRSRTDRPGREKRSFSFIWVEWTEPQLEGLRGWLANHDNSVEMLIQALTDQSWKISISENQQSGRLLCSITDKGGRQGCSGLSWGIEHSDIRACVAAAYYYAIEVIGNSFDAEEDKRDLDLW